MNNKNLQICVRLASALFATFMMFALALLVQNKFSIWDKLGAREKFWTILASAYAVFLTISGWLYGLLKWRIVGFVHALLMLGIAGLVLYGILGAQVTNPSADDPAAGIIATANVAFVAIGAFSAVCGFGIIFFLFRKS
jgi:hypothetical protein